MDKFGIEALTFDDVLLQPGHSEVLPRDVGLNTRLTKKIDIEVPLVSSPMDTVTESRMAIAMAREGGVGIVHKSLGAGRQADEVLRVKRSEHAVIVDPVVCKPDDKLHTVTAIMEKYRISGVPVVTDDGKLTGILTNRDLRFEDDFERRVSEVMTRDKLITAPPSTNIEGAKDILRKHKVEKLPLVDKDGTLKGMFTIKDIEKARKYPHAAKDAKGRLLVGAAVGVRDDLLERVAALVEVSVDVVVIDSAHGHSAAVLRAISRVKEKYPELQLIGGNVATHDGAKAICEAGADAVRVGIGPGSICTTRVVAGVGVPQLTAIHESARAADKYDVPVIADGGVRYSGDAVKALAAGASSVMLGSMLAGTDESPGELELYQGRSFKVYRGMGSLGAMKAGSPDRYFQEKGAKLVPEGVEGRVPHRGSVSDTVFQVIGGLRSGMGYAGAGSIAELRRSSRFLRVTAAGTRESHPHDVAVTKEAPNYSS